MSLLFNNLLISPVVAPLCKSKCLVLAELKRYEFEFESKAESEPAVKTEEP